MPWRDDRISDEDANRDQNSLMKGVKMAIEELVKKIDTKALKAEAKKRGIKIACVKKIDIARQLPADVLEKLASGK